MTDTNSQPKDPDELIKRWQTNAQLWLSIAGQWSGVITALKAANQSIPDAVFDAMKHQGAALQRQIASGTEYFWMPTQTVASTEENVSETPPKRSSKIAPPPGYSGEEEVLESMRKYLNGKSFRPADLAHILEVPKSLVEYLLDAYSNLFKQTGDRGWWEARK